MEVHDDLVSFTKKLLGFAGSFGPSSTPLADVLLNLGNSTIGSRRRKSVRLNPHDRRVEILDDRVRVVAVSRCKESGSGFNVGVHT